MRRLMLATAAVTMAIALVSIAIYVLSERQLRDRAAVSQFSAVIPDDAASLELGRHIARTRGCFGCHGQHLEGKNFDEQWDWPKRAVAPNLAAYARNHDVQTIEAAVRQGIGADGRALMSMPSYNFVRLNDTDLVALIAYLRSAPVIDNPLPRPALGWRARWDIAWGKEMSIADWVQQVPALRMDPAEQPLLAQGEYLAMTMCNECHGLDLRGESYYYGRDGGRPTPDLAVVAAYNRGQFETLIESGYAPDGRKLGLMALVAPDRFTSLSTAEVDSLYAYLKTLNQQPVPEAPWRPRRP